MGNPATAKGTSTRARILAEARRALVERGYGGLVLREVAAASGVKLGNLQYYFATRDALVAELIRAEAFGDVVAIREREDGSAPEAALRALVSDLNQRWRGDSGIVFATLTTLAQHDPAFRELRDEIYARFYETLQPILEAIDPGHGDEEYALRARLITALIDGSPMQVGVRSTRRFMARLQDLAVDIAESRPPQTPASPT